MIEPRPLKEIVDDVKTSRTSKAKIAWSPDEIASDMTVVVDRLQTDLEKYLRKGMDAPAKRIRTMSKILETLGKAFRTQSVK